jgi:hypothetical protein
MMRDIELPEVEGIAVAIVPDSEAQEDGVWNVYLLNLKPQRITGVLVSSRGYGGEEGELVRTSELRHYFDEIAPMSFQKIEPIHPQVFRLSNEYWVSFYIGEVIYDKRFIFLPETIGGAFFTQVPLLEQKGVMIS